MKLEQNTVRNGQKGGLARGQIDEILTEMGVKLKDQLQRFDHAFSGVLEATHH